MNQITQITVPKNASDIVVFVHGFGVRFDSRGMFTDIQASLPSEWGSVLFDFYKVDGNDVYITSVEGQIKRLDSLLTTVSSDYPNAKLHIIAHSKGCIITALCKPRIKGRVIMLAPPEAFGTKLEKYFQRYPGAQNTGNELIIPRKDGTTTHIPLTFFKETATIAAEEAILNYSHEQKIHLLQTTNDEVIGETTYTHLQQNPNIHITQLAADHNFTGQHRSELLNYIHAVLEI